MHHNLLSILSVQFIAHQRDLHALPRPVLPMLIKRTRDPLLLSAPCQRLPPLRNAKA
ncbi:hypothetical protein T11_1546 [Trichinella zimbabwensis]|uniref:Uncharacterized protein n=1 Tax=Trichinella zimbabwensis TaxID=268475 RepID=A0A0V1FL95_9BILA|nr:hypothetical protein T11_9597 [Trichinella zimbabwensis]KRY95190.1 hypothetical protein T11_1546 [Trichinella zimbabwensis]